MESPQRDLNPLQAVDLQYLRIFDILPLGAVLFSLDGLILRTNEVFRRFSGYGKMELTGRPFIELTRPEDRDEFDDCIRRLTAGDIPLSCDERQIIGSDGLRIWIRSHLCLIDDQPGSPLACLALMENVADRKLAEQSLEQSRKELEHLVTRRTGELANAITGLKKEIEERQRAMTLFRQLLESAPDAMVITDDEGKIALVNAITEELFGYDRSELKGLPVETLMPERYRHGHETHRHHYSDNPNARAMGIRRDLWGLRKDGTEFPAEISLGPLRTDDGVFVFSAIRDVTARRRAEEELRDSRERFDLAVRGTDAGVWDWDLRSNEVYFSPRWKSMLGYGDDELANNFDEWETRMHPDERDASLQTVNDYLEGRTAEYELEHRLRHKDGSYRWILARGAVVRDEEGNAYRMVGSHIDITARRQAEETLRENEVQMRAAQRIQQHLLPDEAPDLPGFDIGGASIPADFTAGDSYDFLPMVDDTLGVVIGDVSGHGFSSALLMASTHARLRSLAETELDIGEIFTRANASLIRETAVVDFVTAVLAHVDPRTRRLHYVSAGHPNCYVLDRRGEIKAELKSTGLPLAILADTTYTVGEAVQLEEGDIVVLLTDGVLEARSEDEEYFDVDRALTVVRENLGRPAAEIADRLCRGARDFCDCTKADDDITAVVVKLDSSAPIR